MMKMFSITVFTLILLGSLVNGNQDKYKQAEIRANLAKAKSVAEALAILKNSGIQGRMNMNAPESLQSGQPAILRAPQGLHSNSDSIIEPRNGGCEPRVICEEVPVDHASNANVLSYPKCLEIHRCGGCCQEPQFPCVPVKQKSVTFSPLYLIYLDGTGQYYEDNRPLTVMNHTKCECKCSKTEAQCQREGKKLDSTLCQCIQPKCSPECLISSTCSMISGSNTPRCTCRRRIYGETNNYCSSPNQRPNAMCTRCETVYG